MINKAFADNSEQMLAEALNEFRCDKNADIEKFLRYKAIDFEDNGWCSVYLILDREKFIANNICIVAYFTLSHKSIFFLPKVSKNKRKDLSTNKNSEIAHVVLIGQLGKYIHKDYAYDIKSSEILDDAFSVIKKASNIIVCRGVLVECNKEEKVHAVYENYGFKYLQVDNEHYQFYKRI